MDDGERGALAKPWRYGSGAAINRVVGCGYAQGVGSLSQRCLAASGPAAFVARIVLASSAETVSQHALLPGDPSGFPGDVRWH